MEPTNSWEFLSGSPLKNPPKNMRQRRHSYGEQTLEATGSSDADGSANADRERPASAQLQGSRTFHESPNPVCANFLRSAPLPRFVFVDEDTDVEDTPPCSTSRCAANQHRTNSRILSVTGKQRLLDDAPPFNRIGLNCRKQLVGSSRGDYDAHGLGWQASKATVKERMAHLFQSETMADVFFIVGREEDQQTQRIPAHKFVLSIGSAVFDAMFNGGLATSAPATTGQDAACTNCSQEIRIPDIEPKAFLILLGFLYSDEAVVGSDTVMTTLYTAKKYAVPALELICVDFLKEHLCADNAFMLLMQARLFDEPHLAAMCLDIIDRETSEAIQAEGFCDIDHETLCSFLKRDALRISELALFQAAVRWSTEACKRKDLPLIAENQRSELGEALHLIRFPLMPIEEFAQHVAVTRLLSDSELVSLFLHFTVNPKPPVDFPILPRCCIFGKEMVVSRFQRIETRWGYNGTPDRIKFTVDAPIYVLGFGLYGSMHGPYDYSCTIEIINFATGHVLARTETSFLCDGTPNVFRVLFREPVEIQSGITYIASAFLARGPDSHYGSKGLRRIIRQTPGGPITFQFSYAAGNNNGTSVDDGQLPEIIFCTKVN